MVHPGGGNVLAYEPVARNLPDSITTIEDMLNAFDALHDDLGVSRPVLAGRLKRLVEAGISPMMCCGEQLEEREAGKALETVQAQVKASLETVMEAGELIFGPSTHLYQKKR